MTWEQRRRELDRLAARYEYARERGRECVRALRDLAVELDRAEAASVVLQELSKALQVETHAKVAAIVSSALAVLDRPYEFDILFEVKRGRTEAVPVLRRDGMEVDPFDCGGGVLDLVSFALRLVCLTMQRPQPRQLLVLDEPFKFLSVDMRPAAREMLLGLASELGVQVILTTHHPELELGDVIRLA